MDNTKKILSLVTKAATVVMALHEFWQVHGAEFKEIVNPVINYFKELKEIGKNYTEIE